MFKPDNNVIRSEGIDMKIKQNYKYTPWICLKCYTIGITCFVKKCLVLKRSKKSTVSSVIKDAMAY